MQLSATPHPHKLPNLTAGWLLILSVSNETNLPLVQVVTADTANMLLSTSDGLVPCEVAASLTCSHPNLLRLLHTAVCRPTGANATLLVACLPLQLC